MLRLSFLLNKFNSEYDYDVNSVVVYLSSAFVGSSGEAHELAGYLCGPPEIKSSSAMYTEKWNLVST